MSTKEEQCHTDFIPNSLQLSFSTTMIFEHHVVSNWLILSNARQLKGSQKHIDDLWKTLQARLAILLLFMWLNLVKNTKLPMYPEEGSSHYVVQQIFFFLMISFWMIFFLFFVFCFLFLYFFTQKEGITCVILALHPMKFHGYQLHNSEYRHWSNSRLWP